MYVAAGHDIGSRKGNWKFPFLTIVGDGAGAASQDIGARYAIKFFCINVLKSNLYLVTRFVTINEMSRLTRNVHNANFFKNGIFWPIFSPVQKSQVKTTWKNITCLQSYGHLC